MRSVRGKLDRILVTSSGCKLPQIWGSKLGERVVQGFSEEEPERIAKLEALHGLSLLVGFKPEMICLFCTRVPILPSNYTQSQEKKIKNRAILPPVQGDDRIREGLGDHCDDLVGFKPEIICLFAPKPPNRSFCRAISTK